jgi:hypothetical protein
MQISILTTPNEQDRATFARNLGYGFFKEKAKKKGSELDKGRILCA